VLLLLIVAVVANSQTTPSPTENATDGQGTTQASGGIEVDSTPVTSPDGIKLTGLRAVSRRDPDPPLVGDTVTVSYSLTNVGDQPLQLESTFVGARNPADDNINIEDMNEGRVLSPGETVNAQGRILLIVPAHGNCGLVTYLVGNATAPINGRLSLSLRSNFYAGPQACLES
jgi:hypothetical protein